MSSFIGVAYRGNNHWLLYVLTVVLVILAAFAGQLPLNTVIGHLVASGRITAEMKDLFSQTADFRYLGLPSYQTLALLLISFFAALGVLLLAVRYGHGRSPLTLITPSRIQWKKIFLAAGLWFVLTAMAEVVMYARSPSAYHFFFNAGAWIPLIIVALLLLPFQTSFEEMLTRGYLLQGFGLLTRNKWIAIALSSLFFAAMHLGNPEIDTFGIGVMMLYYLSVAVFLGILTLLDDSLELALGIHAATNIYGAGFVSFSGSALRTEALVQVDAVDPWLVLLLGYLMMGVFYFVVKKHSGLKAFRSLSERISPDTIIETQYT